MKKVNVLEKFNTSLGVTFIVSEGDFKIGDMICDQNNDLYEIEKNYTANKAA